MNNNSSSSKEFPLNQQIFQLSQLAEQIHATLIQDGTENMDTIFEDLAHLTGSLSQLSSQVAEQE